MLSTLSRRHWTILLLALGTTVAAGLLTALAASPVLTFVVAAVALATVAALVSDATEQLGSYLGPGATGVLQSALGNLPELFVGVFSLRAGLVTVIQSALIGSILANNLLVLGLAVLIGGRRHGTQRFASGPPRMIATLMVLAVSALIIPTAAVALHEPAGQHAEALSVAVALILLVVFGASIPVSIGPAMVSSSPPEEVTDGRRWPLPLAVGLLLLAGVGSAFVSDWFVDALRPAIELLHISEAFTGLVIVAIAGNAVENVVGVQLFARNRADYGISVILNSPLQIALFLIPVLVLLSFLLGGATLTLVMPLLLLTVLALSTAVSALITFDGESIWIEGVALIGLYAIVAAAFWWG
ncbi:MAG: sodium:proton exchanger [Chloroflexi bacterium]|nr:sodium:proton exchanger [Chloroflexota bacterium]